MTFTVPDWLQNSLASITDFFIMIRNFIFNLFYGYFSHVVDCIKFFVEFVKNIFVNPLANWDLFCQTLGFVFDFDFPDFHFFDVIQNIFDVNKEMVEVQQGVFNVAFAFSRWFSILPTWLYYLFGLSFAFMFVGLIFSFIRDVL